MSGLDVVVINYYFSEVICEAKYEFGIMIDEPKSSEDYINYIPKRYNCISADNIFIESIVDKLLSVVCYWYSIDNKKNGLAYYGITLISPESCGSICKLIDDSDEYLQLKHILMEAYKTGEFVIHFGI